MKLSLYGTNTFKTNWLILYQIRQNITYSDTIKEIFIKHSVESTYNVINKDTLYYAFATVSPLKTKYTNECNYFPYL